MTNTNANKRINKIIDHLSRESSSETRKTYNLLPTPQRVSLRGKTIFITGASRGIGLAIAKRCAQDCCDIIIAAKTAELHPKLKGTIYSAAKEIEAINIFLCLPVICDIRKEEMVKKGVEAAVHRFCGIDILINNTSAISMTNTKKTIVYCICANCKQPILIRNAVHKLPMNHHCDDCGQYLLLVDYATWAARTAARVCTGFIPFVGPAYKLCDGAVTGNPWMMFRGGLSLIGDVFTFGGATPLIEAACDYGPDGVELVQACFASEPQQIALLSIGIALGVVGANDDQKEFLKAVQVKEATRGVSKLAGMVRQGGKIAKGVKIDGSWTKHLRGAAHTRNDLIRSLQEIVKDKQAFDFSKKVVDIFLDSTDDIPKLFDVLAGLEINAWSYKRKWSLL